MLRFAGRSLLCAAAAMSTSSPNVLQAAKTAENKLDGLSPRKIAAILDRYIVGQSDGKKAVAISLRNRWRRRQLRDKELRKEVVPKNMLLIGPTGVGKTEISRRMARITDAPFIKVEATKYTEVGFKGKDVESIIEDLYTNAKSKARKMLEAERQEEALAMAIDIVYGAWSSLPRRYRLRRRQATATPPPPPPAKKAAAAESAAKSETDGSAAESDTAALPSDAQDRNAARGETATSATPDTTSAEESGAEEGEVSLEYFRDHYKDLFRDDIVAIDVAAPPEPQRATPHGTLVSSSVGLMLGISQEARRPRMVVRKPVIDAVPLAMQEALNKLIDDNQVNTLARALAEEEGIIFIDEIDKVVVDRNTQNADVSSTGVQQDLLPLVEGSNVTMKDGSVIATDNILFICSGAFHIAKTSDMIAELQGRLPVRVELKPLTEEDFRRILTEPKFNLLRQQTEMMKTENIKLEFTEDGVRALARVTTVINAQGQNIGARRLNTVLERVMDKYSFDCDEYEGKSVVIDESVVKKATEKLEKNISIARYLL